MSKQDKSKYPTTIAGLWKTRGGKQLRSMPIDERTFDQLQQVLAKAALGGKLIVRTVSEQVREEKGDKFPEAFLEYISPEQLAAEKAAVEAKDGL